MSGRKKVELLLALQRMRLGKTKFQEQQKKHLGHFFELLSKSEMKSEVGYQVQSTIGQPFKREVPDNTRAHGKDGEVYRETSHSSHGRPRHPSLRRSR